MKIVLHGFGTFPVVFRHLIAVAAETAPEIEWSAILPTAHHLEIMREVITPENILVLEEHLARGIAPLADSSELAGYPGQIFSNIEAQKRAFKHRPAWEQLARAAEIYRIYKQFLIRIRPSHLLISQIEDYEGRMLPHLANELGIKVMVPTGLRNLGGTFFSPDALETLPAYRRATPATRDAARAYVARFRDQSISSYTLPNPEPDDPPLPVFGKPLSQRIIGFVRHVLARPDLFEREYLRIAVLNNLPWFRDQMWRYNAKRTAREFDVAQLGDLPPRFIYYPLHITPESSINTPAPYFVDQFRAVDAIRFAMPNDHILVVKEHPLALSTRPVGFLRALRRRAGIVVAHFGTSSRALIERANVTISVTGTATLEAFLLGRPALTLGSSYISGYLGGVCPIDQLRDRITDCTRQKISDEDVVKVIAEIMSVRYDFVQRDPNYPGQPTLRRRNLERYIAAIKDHVARENSPVQGAGE